MGPITWLSHLFHDLLKGFEVTTITRGSSCIEERPQTDLFLFAVIVEKRQIVMIITNYIFKISFTGPCLRQNVLESLPTALDLFILDIRNAFCYCVW